MLVYRLSRQKHKNELSGYGASLNGQRWNSKGFEVVYTAQTWALANCEVAVHVPLGILPRDYYMLVIDIPDDIHIKEIKASDLPLGWDAIPCLSNGQVVGDAFVREGKYAVLKVPSVTVKGEYNFALNTKHHDFQRVRIMHTEPFPFDPRYFKR